MEPIAIPIDCSHLGGDAIVCDGRVLSEGERAAIVEVPDVPPEVTWLNDFDFIYAQRQHDSSLKAIRKAETDDLRKLRVPVWIQGEEVPSCCGKQMHFVAQIDDDVVCAEVPKGAKLWWHDAASFYVFACAECLNVKAVGQQF